METKTLSQLNRQIAAATSGVAGIAGRPFIGPAGKLPDKALAAAGIDRHRGHVTNAVKHFKRELRGKRRLHARPNAGEVKHYRWRLEKELDLVQPGLVEALGATAVLALLGKSLLVMKNRGPHDWDGRPGSSPCIPPPCGVSRMKKNGGRHLLPLSPI